ncbi:MAG: hypothetical protein M1812_003484 [Candelaria pacifica]|nr:MAG: hypothetical protein M1812_003484 [Candelaria pacifica]
MTSPNPQPTDLPTSDPLPSTQTTQTTHTTPPPKPPQTPPTTTNLPSSSLSDNGLTRRPRDARLIHMVLANLGVTAYAERVPLQILDFAYRYTQATLQDALHLSSEGYGVSSSSTNNNNNNNNNNTGNPTTTGNTTGNITTTSSKGTGAGGSDLSHITLPALRLSIASRTNYQFQPSLPKEFLLELANERNRIGLPVVGRDWGVRLPHEKYCLTGVGWGLREEWDSEGDEVEEGGDDDDDDGGVGGVGDGGIKVDGEDREGEGDEEGDERMEDFFGELGDEGGGDREMEDA